jgi:hypothetical protein
MTMRQTDPVSKRIDETECAAGASVYVKRSATAATSEVDGLPKRFSYLKRTGRR